MNRHIQQPLPLIVIGVVLGVLLLSVVLFFGLTVNTRGPVEILLALLIAALALLFRALARRSR